jgi:hypothetical protein
MQMKKKLVVFAIAVAMFVGATAPVKAVSICDMDATTFEIWFIQQFYC